MNLDQQAQYFEDFYTAALGVIRNRQSDYAPDGVALLNVLDTCVTWNVTPTQVLGTLLDKQTTALQAFLKRGRLDSDPIRSRSADAINYYIFIAMFAERERDILEAWQAHWRVQKCDDSDPRVCKACTRLTWIGRRLGYLNVHGR